jgi:hypothetical protein
MIRTVNNQSLKFVIQKTPFLSRIEEYLCVVSMLRTNPRIFDCQNLRLKPIARQSFSVPGSSSS